MSKFSEDLSELLFVHAERQRMYHVVRINGTTSEHRQHARASARFDKLFARFTKKYRPEGDL